MERAAAWLIQGTPPLHPTTPSALPLPSEVFLADGRWGKRPLLRPTTTRRHARPGAAARGEEGAGGGMGGGRGEECMALGTLHAWNVAMRGLLLTPPGEPARRPDSGGARARKVRTSGGR